MQVLRSSWYNIYNIQYFPNSTSYFCFLCCWTKHSGCESLSLDKCQLQDVTILLHSILCWTSQAFCEWLRHCYGLLFTELWMHLLFLPHLSLIFPDSHTHSVPTPISLWLTHDSYTHIVLCCQCMIDSLADLCLHTHCQKLCCVITQSMLEILSTFTHKGSSALGPLTNDIASAFVYLQKSIGSHSEVRGL